MPRRAVRRISACIVVAAVAIGAASAAAQDVAVGPRLRSGDQFRLEVTRVRENSSPPQEQGRITTPVDVRVVSAAPAGLMLEWTPGPATVAPGPIADDPLLTGASGALSGMVLRLTLNGDGEFTGLANEAEVAPKLQAAVDIITNGLAAKLAPEQRRGFGELVARILSPAALLGSATREVQMYFGLNGLTLRAGRAIEIDIEQPNPLGGGVLPALIRIEVESATSDAAVLRTTTTYDGAALLRLTRMLVEQSGVRVSAEELAKLPSIDVEEHGRYVLDRALGLMREVVVSRRVVAGPERRLDRWEIRLAKAPNR